MKKIFKGNVAVNSSCSKNGIKWEYKGKLAENEIDYFINKNNWLWGSYGIVGLKVTNTETNKVVFEYLLNKDIYENGDAIYKWKELEKIFKGEII